MSSFIYFFWSQVYQLNLWRPSSDVQALLKEGCRYKVYNLATSDWKKRGAVGALQLNATKKTQFQDLQVTNIHSFNLLLTRQID